MERRLYSLLCICYVQCKYTMLQCVLCPVKCVVHCNLCLCSVDIVLLSL